MSIMAAQAQQSAVPVLMNAAGTNCSKLSSGSSSPMSPLLGRVPRGSCCWSHLHFYVSFLQSQQLKADARVQRCNCWSYRWKTNAASAAGTKAFNTVRQLLEAAGWSPGSSHPPLSPDWAWCRDVMLCSPAQPLAVSSLPQGPALHVSILPWSSFVSPATH